jgi:hypothetical protein
MTRERLHTLLLCPRYLPKVTTPCMNTHEPLYRDDVAVSFMSHATRRRIVAWTVPPSCAIWPPKSYNLTFSGLNTAFLAILHHHIASLRNVICTPAA